MSTGEISPTIFHFLERNVGRRVVVIVERDFGYEGLIEAVSHTPPGIWLADAEAIVLRTTVANPIPRIVAKERKSEIFIHLNSVQRIEILPEKASKGK
ncbi:MAG: hypothetical protein DRO43_02190 [Candidatus Hecatellales archaeon]|nr:MAG: hypothetical protein DRO43_02190 [Candidatus Hecatellales archaeon]